MEKSMIIVANGLSPVGGIGNCLLNMLSVILKECPEYQIDLLLSDPDSGKILSDQEKRVNVIPLKYKHDVSCSTKKLLMDALKLRNTIDNLKLFVGRQLHKHSYQTFLMKCISDLVVPLTKEYDVAISYQVVPGYMAYFVADHVIAKKKIAWAHWDRSQEDVKKIGFLTGARIKDSYRFRKTASKFDKIISVSNAVQDSMRDEVGANPDQLEVIYNVVDKERVLNKAKEDVHPVNKDSLSLLTVGRVSFEKGIVLALEVMKMLHNDGYRFKWYFVGHNLEKEYTSSFVKKNHLEDCFVEVGTQGNPYPCFRDCDIYVHCSYIEGYCTTTNEARMLGKPVVTTDVAGAEEQITNGANGFVVKKDAEEIYLAVKKLLDSKELRDRFGLYNARLEFDNKESERKIRELLK